MNPHSYDPARHDSQLVALFEHRQRAEHARTALVGAGLPAEVVDVVDDPSVEPSRDGEGFWPAMRRLFAPDQEVRQLSEALQNGRAVLIVHPQTIAERETAIEVLENFGPIDLDDRDEPGRPPAAPASPPSTTTYTYGVPEAVARSMTAEEQVVAQAPDSRQHSVRIVEERLRVGWRDRSAGPSRVRRYVAERNTQGDRVELLEEEIPAPTDRPIP